LTTETRQIICICVSICVSNIQCHHLVKEKTLGGIQFETKAPKSRCLS